MLISWSTYRNKDISPRGNFVSIFLTLVASCTIKVHFKSLKSNSITLQFLSFFSNRYSRLITFYAHSHNMDIVNDYGNSNYRQQGLRSFYTINVMYLFKYTRRLQTTIYLRISYRYYNQHEAHWWQELRKLGKVNTIWVLTNLLS